MDLNQRPQRKKTLPLRFQDPSENITPKRSAKKQNTESDNEHEEKKIKIVKENVIYETSKPPKFQCESCYKNLNHKTI